MFDLSVLIGLSWAEIGLSLLIYIYFIVLWFWGLGIELQNFGAFTYKYHCLLY